MGRLSTYSFSSCIGDSSSKSHDLHIAKSDPSYGKNKQDPT